MCPSNERQNNRSVNRRNALDNRRNTANECSIFNTNTSVASTFGKPMS